MKKKRLLKTLSFSSLAVLMAAAGTFAFAPLGASPSTLANADASDTINTVAGNGIEYAPSPLGLDPENDPVIYTTASGLEIKYGGLDMSQSYAGSAVSGLKGYPYFTMGTYNSTAINWIIIGVNPNTTIFSQALTYYLFSTWQTVCNPTYSNINTNYKHFLQNTYEITTPAGSAIKNVISSKSYIADFQTNLMPTANSEITSGCVLALSEKPIGTTCAFEADNINNYQGSDLQTAMANLYNTILSPEEQKLIVPQTFTNAYYNTSSTSTNQSFFPLATRGEKFTITSYLSSQALRVCSDRTLLRSGKPETQKDIYWWKTDGTIYTNEGNGSWAYDNWAAPRPACVVSLT